MNFFSPEFEELHNEEEQLLRQDKISELEINWIHELDKNGNPRLTKKGNQRRTFLWNRQLKTCRIENYLVSLHGYTCPDFHFRGLPCKHMYKLANKLNLFIDESERSRELIADFSKGYADGWRFVVRPCNYASLDIIWQSLLAQDEKRGKNSKKELTLTQSNLYNFQQGFVFYDDMAAYNNIWSDALEKINFCLQIDSATESIAARPIVGWEDDKFIRRQKPIYGRVDFSVYKPNVERTQLEKIKSYSCRQDEFVSLLQTGHFDDVNGELQTL